MRVCGVVAVACVLAICSDATPAQEWPEVMFPGHGHIGADFNAYRQPAGGWIVAEVKANEYDHCYRAGQEVVLSVTLRNVSDEAVTVKGRWAWHWLGDMAGDDRGGVRLVSRGQESAIDLEAQTIAPRGQVQITLRRKAPREGLLGLCLHASDGQTRTSRWVTNVAVLYAPAGEKCPDSPFFGELRGVRLWQKLRELPTLGKLGVRWVRVGASMGAVMPERGRYDWAELDELAAGIRRQKMLAMFLPFNAPAWARSYGRLDWPQPGNKHKQDLTPSPDRYGDWAEFLGAVVGRYKDVIRAVCVWNEPWEAGGITDWGGTGAHYRNLFRMARLGIDKADPTVLVGGSDSDANIVDNLLCDPSWKDYVSLLTVHTHGGFAGAMIGQWVGGSVPLWNTEMWYTALSDRTVQWQLMEQARGCDKVNIAMLGNMFSAGYKAGGYYDPKDAQDIPDIIPQPNAMAYNAMTHFLEGLRFIEEIRPEHRPYALLFERRGQSVEGVHRACMVLFGQSVDSSQQGWWQGDPGASGAAILDLPPGVLGVYDKMGCRIEPLGDGRYRIPLTTEPVYVTAESVQALRKVPATLETVAFERPCHLAVIDPIDGMGVGAKFDIQITNVAPSALPVVLQCRGEAGWEVEPAQQELGTVAPGETRTVQCAIRKTGDLTGGRWMLNLNATTPVGKAMWREAVSSRSIPRWKPVLGGGVEAWQKAGIELVVLSEAADVCDVAAAMPWEATAATGPAKAALGRWALAWDQEHLYLIAQVHTTSRGGLPWDQTRDDWYVLHPGGYAYKQAPQWPFTGENVQMAIDSRDNPTDYLYPPADARARRYPCMRVDHLLGFYESRQGASQAWRYLRPGGVIRHRYPFSSARAMDQGLAEGVKTVVRRDVNGRTTTFEAAIPWSLFNDIAPREGTVIPGIEIKLTPSKWMGLYSAAGKGLAHADSWVFQPYWITGVSFASPWRLGPAVRGNR